MKADARAPKAMHTPVVGTCTNPSPPTRRRRPGPSRAVHRIFDSSGGRIAGLDEDLVDTNVLGLGQRPDHGVGHVDRIEPHISVLGCLSEEAARLLVRRTRGQLRAAVARLDRGHFDAGADALGAQSL